MSNKKTIMAFSGIQILIFHLWIYLANGNVIEMFMKQTAYIGVDIFFFLSAYSLAGREIKSYWTFLKNRFGTVYIKFVLFAIIATCVKGWNILRLLEVITGINLITSGGGAFLWFLPAILLVYILFPIYQKADGKNRVLTLSITCIIWIVLAIVFTNSKEVSHIYIMWNRIPILLLGYYLRKCDWFTELLQEKRLRLVIGGLLVVIGSVLNYLFAYQTRLQFPIKDMFYLVGIPACIGLILIVGMIPENKFISVVGSSTLEMYAIQMIWGYGFANKMIKLTDSKLLTNILAVIFVIVLAIVFRLFYDRIVFLIGRRIMSKKECV